MLTRNIYSHVIEELTPGKVILIYGARRVGKTVLLEQILKDYKGKYNMLNGEDYSTEMLFSERTASNYNLILQDIDLLIVDEAQNIKDIGKILKLIVDTVKNVSVIASGSSSFDLFNKTGEPLVGRSYEFKVFPFSLQEMVQKESKIDAFHKLEERLIFGLYPELTQINDFTKKKNYLNEIVNSYLLKDILMIDGIKNSSKMKDLLRLISFQTGNEVSYEELGRQLGMSRNTIEKYLDLLAKTFVIYKLPAFSKNPRKEVSKSSKWYFYDNGIRNAVIGDFRPISLRSDVGALWENLLISERIKWFNNSRQIANFYFWRNYNGQEIDLIEEHNGELKAFEFKWGESKAKIPQAFVNQYPNIEIKTINKQNFTEFAY